MQMERGLTPWAQAHNLLGRQSMEHKMQNFETAGLGPRRTALSTHSAQAEITTESTIREGKYTGEKWTVVILVSKNQFQLLFF